MKRSRSSTGVTSSWGRLGAVVATCVILATARAPLARADGKSWPERAVEATPRMPTQRGLVAFRDGVETLVIEAPVESESRSLGWIVPIPAEPERVEPIRPGLFESLRACFGPVVVHDRSIEVKALLVAFGLALLFVSLAAASGNVERAFFHVILVALVLGLLSLFLVTASLGMYMTPSSSASEVGVVSSQRVGAYEVQVLRAPSAGALEDWLATNGFASLTGEESTIVDDYVRASWVFLAARIVPEGGGAVTPHPISVRFPASEAVYPLRLTALAGGTDLDLWVVAEHEASSPRLSSGFVDELQRTTRAAPFGADADGWGARHFTVGIGHPDLENVLWEGCVLTRLRGQLTAGDMSEDLTFQWSTPRACREEFYSLVGALSTSGMVFLGIGAVGLAALPLLRWDDFRRRARGPVARGVGWVLGGGLVAALGVFWVLPVRDVAVVSSYSGPLVGFIEAGTLAGLLGEGLADPPEGGVDALRRRVAELVADEDWRLRSDALPELAAPGGYQVREDDDQVIVEYYDDWARPVRVWPLEEPTRDDGAEEVNAGQGGQP